MKWATFEHAKVDRAACPRLIRKFSDARATFNFAPKPSRKSRRLAHAIAPHAHDRARRQLRLRTDDTFGMNGRIEVGEEAKQQAEQIRMKTASQRRNDPHSNRRVGLRGFVARAGTATLALTAFALAGLHFTGLLASTAHAQEKAPGASSEVDALKSELGLLKDQLPDQSHAMADVAYHFGNLYFAAEKKNWPLATFYLSETRAHLKWAMRIRPLRKLSNGVDLDVKAMLEALDKTAFAALAEVIAAKDSGKFPAQYEATLAACYSCHAAAEKPFLRLKIPTEPRERLIDFEPANP